MEIPIQLQFTETPEVLLGKRSYMSPVCPRKGDVLSIVVEGKLFKCEVEEVEQRIDDEAHGLVFTEAVVRVKVIYAD